ncbi:MAG: dihydropteroate synthase [Candidatus Peribacteraceae bacterium]
MVSLSSLLQDQNTPLVVAILNVTPDSFYDGGRLGTPELVLQRARECMEEGADILELGAESTGPGSSDLSADEELQRLLPALQMVRDALPDVPIAIDTYKAAVADAALNIGAMLINDITAGRADPDMFSVISRHHAWYAMMYSKDPTPRTTKQDRQYDDVIGHIHTFLSERLELALRAGIDPFQIIVDPGLGHFVSSDPRYSFAILDSLERFTDLGPVLVSPSRKSFLAGPSNLPPSERLPATLTASLTAASHGAALLRTHDIAATKLALLQWSQGRVS